MLPLTCITNRSRSNCAVWFCMQQQISVILCPFPASSLTVLLLDSDAAYVQVVLIPEHLPFCNMVRLYEGSTAFSIDWGIYLEKS